MSETPASLRRYFGTTRRLTLSLALLGAASAGAVELRGDVDLVQNGREARESARALVYFEPAKPVAVEPQEEPFEIVTVKKRFEPESLVVPVGSEVRFPNLDVILHNVFSASGRNRFDLGLYRRGEGKTVTFEHPGVVRVFCNVHHSMVAYVVVVDTPYFTTAGGDGAFRLDGLPAGPGQLTIWHPRTEPWSEEVTLPLAQPLDVDLEIEKPLVPRHQDKDGRPYARRRGSRSYKN